MNKFLVIRAFHLIFIGILLGFIYFYFAAYQPLKVHTLCANSTSEKVLKSDSEDAYELYKNLYQECLTQKSLTLLTLFKEN